MTVSAIEAPDVELTEFEEIDVQKVSGVAQAANGFPHLILKGVAKDAAGGVLADTDPRHAGSVAPSTEVAQPSHSPQNSGRPDDEDDGTPGAHQPWSGMPHMHLHPANGAADANDDGLHQHWHEHSGDSDHDHSHGTGDAATAHDSGYTTAPGYGAGADQSHRSPFDDASRAAPMAGHGQPQAAPNEGVKSVSLIAALAKAVVNGQIDQGPDIELGNQILHLIGQAVINESQEVSAGAHDELGDVSMLTEAGHIIRCWLGHEQGPSEAVMHSAAEAYKAEAAVYKRTVLTAERKKLASQGQALSDGSYPIANEGDLENAYSLARSKHGNWKAALALIARMAKKFGVKNPADSDKSDAGKSLLAEGDTTVQDDTQGDDSLAKAVAAAVTKALEPHKAEIATLRGELAKVKALPRPGGPVMSGAVQFSTPRPNDDLAAKAQLMRDKAAMAPDPQDRASYTQLARKLDAEAAASTA